MKRKPRKMNQLFSQIAFMTFITSQLFLNSSKDINYHKHLDAQTSATLSLSTLTVNSLSTMSFAITTGTSIKTTDCIKFAVSTSYSTTAGAFYSPFASSTCSATSGHSVTCTASGTTLQMNFNSASSTQNLIGSINNFRNPYSKIQITVGVGYYTNCGFAPSNEQSTQFDQFSSGTISTLTMSSNSNTIGQENCVLTLSFTPGTVMKSTGKIDFIVPFWYNTNQVTSNLFYMLDRTAAVSSSSGLTLTSSSLAPSTGTYSFTYSVTSGVEISAGTTVTFKFTNFRNPISTSSVTGFSLFTLDNDGNIADQTITSQSFAGVSDPATLTTTSSSVKIYTDGTTTSDNEVGKTGRNLYLSFTVNVPLELNCYVKITFPDQIKIDIDEKVLAYQGGGFMKTTQTSQTSLTSSTVIKKAYGSGNYILFPSCQDSTQLGKRSQDGTIQIARIVSGTEIQSISAFTIEIGKDNSLTTVIASGTITPSLTLTQGQITLNSFTPNDLEVQTDTTYFISFTLTSGLFSTSFIEIDLPSNIETTSITSCSISASQNINSGASCTYASSKFKITNAFTDSSTFGWDFTTMTTAITLTIDSGATNPYAVMSGGTWSVRTYNVISSSNKLVDSATSTTSFTTTQGTFTSLTTAITVSDPTTYISTSTYTFLFTLSKRLDSGSKIIITYPSEVEAASSSRSCVASVSSVQQTLSSCSFTASSSILSMKVTNDIAISSSVSLLIGGFRSPRSYKPSSAFTITTQDSSGNIIESGTGFIATMSKMSAISSLIVTPTNKTNGGNGLYTLRITASSVPFQSGDKISVLFPTEITFNTSGGQVCQMKSPTTTIPCTVSGQTLTTTISLSSDSTVIEFTVTNIKNAPTIRTSSVFRNVFNYVLDGTTQYSVQELATTTASIKNTVAANILKYSLTQTTTELEKEAIYTIKFTPSNAISSTGAVKINWPSQIDPVEDDFYATITTNRQYTDSYTYDNKTRQVLFTGIFTSSYSSEITIEMGPIVNPKTSANLNGFIINTYDDVNLVFNIDVLADNILKPGLLCNDPCSSCSATNKSDCYTCWSDTGLPYLMKYSGYGTCLTKCPTGYTSNGNITSRECVACDISCVGCQDKALVDDKYRCTTCASGYNFKTSDSRCLKSCTDGYYQLTSTTCGTCSTPCKNCETGPLTCTECNSASSFPYLLQNFCFSSCPLGYVQNVGKCDKCASPCLTCSDNVNNCKSCDPTSGKSYVYSGQCYTTCPSGTTANTEKGTCDGCQSGCQICDNFDQAKCLLCSSGLYLHNSECLASCPKGYQVNFDKTECENLQNFPLIPFPFIIVCVILVGVALGGYLKDKKSIILTNIILLWGPIEFLAFLTQFGLSFIFSTYEYAALSLVALLIYLILNIAYTAYFVCKMKKQDSDYRHWCNQKPRTSKLILAFSAILSFKLLKLHYSFFFGHDNFKANFSKPELFTKSMIAFTVVHIILSNGLIIAFDLSGLIFEYEWGTQFYIIMIETLIISIAMIILEIIELIKMKQYLKDTPGYQQVYSDSVMNVSEMGDQNFDRKMREDMLKSIMGKVKGNQDLFLNNKLDDLFSKFGNRRCNSMIQFDSEKEQDPRLTKSLPHSPTSITFDKDAYLNERFGNNVYADSQPPNPLGRNGKEFNDADTQVKSSDIGKILARKGGDFVNFEGSESSRRKDKKNRKRGRKNQYYTQIDAEDDEELDNNNDFDDDENNDLDIIKEEDEQEEQRMKAEKKRLKEAEELRQKEAQDEEDRQRKEEEMRVQADIAEKAERERLRLEQEAQDKAEREQQERLQKQEEERQEEERLVKEQEEIDRLKALNQLEQETFEVQAVGQGESAFQQPNKLLQDSARSGIQEHIITEDDGTEDKAGLNQNVLIEDSLNDFSKMLNQHDPSEVQVPPDAQKRTFNENDILGDFDRDEKGNVIVLQDENGNYVDKQGRRVNERGYLIQSQTGDIIENQNLRKMFDQQDIDERGEIPAPFCVEKYNFNPFNIRGNFDYDKQGKPIILQNKQRELVDKQGRRVNKNGWLIDKQGHITDGFGRKKFDKKQLANEGQDLPKLFNYNGRRFDIMDICGQFDRDPSTGNIILRMNKNGQNTDNLGRLVNEKGYLIDQNENIINKEGKKIFDKKHLKQGEIPKIFPFTKFKVKNVTGNFEMDPLGNPILDKNQNGQWIDRDGKIVNGRGYFINQNGDVIDKYGKIMFDKEILDEEGEIPKVFRTGLLKSDTASSLSRLMSEIERNQPFEESDNQRIQNELARYKKDGQQQETQRRDSAGTSMDSMMGDTPSNYNVANQRFDAQQKMRNNALNKRNQHQIVEEDDSQYGDELDPQMRKKRIKRKKKKAPQAYKDPSDKDILMAKAYGGMARGTILKNQPQQSNRMMTAESNRGISQPRNLRNLAGSISGYQKDIPQNSSMSRDRIEFRDANQTNQSFLEGTNEPSIMAVPDHHIREQRLKQRKMNELKRKNKLAQKKRGAGGGLGGDPDFEKMFGKDIDEFLEDSDWDIESFGKMSNFSKGTYRSAMGDGRIRGLESIYLQRIETSMKKGPRGGVQSKTKQGKPNFRVMQDKFVEEADMMQELGIKGPGGQDHSSEMSQGALRNKNLKLMDSANTTAMAQNKSDANIFQKNKKPINQTQYRPGNDFKTNRFDL